MSNKVINITLLVLIVLFVSFRITSACNQMDKNQQSVESAMELPASYSGVIPCADCPAIEYRLYLEEDQFTEFRTYMDRNPEPFVASGTWSVSSDSLSLTSADGESISTFLYDGDSITMLDQEMNRVSGPTAEMYILNKDLEMTSILNRHQQLRQEGVLLTASGNEPFWSVRINQNGDVIFQTPEMEESGTISQTNSENGTMIWHADIDENYIITSQSTPCKDSMSGFQFTHTVSVQKGLNSQLTGCGRYLTDQNSR